MASDLVCLLVVCGVAIKMNTTDDVVLRFMEMGFSSPCTLQNNSAVQLEASTSFALTGACQICRKGDDNEDTSTVGHPFT